MTVEKIIYKINEELKEVPGIVGMVLGGSRARGIHHPASDIYLSVKFIEVKGRRIKKKPLLCNRAGKH
ncbi:TPA: nucleotidyltransferase domain-containing protein [Enterococcus faecium]